MCSGTWDHKSLATMLYITVANLQLPTSLLLTSYYRNKDGVGGEVAKIVFMAIFSYIDTVLVIWVVNVKFTV